MREKKKFPPLVQPEISRDFIYITDATTSFIAAAAGLKEKKLAGKSFNVGTGKRTSIRELAELVKTICDINTNPGFGKMENRLWDLPDWYANIESICKEIDWQPLEELEHGIKKVIAWQNEINFDTANWNWTKKV